MQRNDSDSKKDLKGSLDDNDWEKISLSQSTQPTDFSESSNASYQLNLSTSLPKAQDGSRKRTSPNNVFQKMKNELFEILTPLKVFGVNIQGTDWAKPVAILYNEPNENNKYVLLTTPVLSSPKAEFEKEKEKKEINRDIEATLSSCRHGILNESLKSQIKGPCEIKIIVPVATHSFFRAHWVGLFLNLKMNKSGEIFETQAHIVDPQKNIYSYLYNFFRFGYIQNAVKKVFGNEAQTKFHFVGHQSMFNCELSVNLCTSHNTTETSRCLLFIKTRQLCLGV